MNEWSEIKEYVGFTDDDSALLAELAPIVEPSLPWMVNRFYAAILKNAGTRSVLENEAQVERLKGTLMVWIREFLTGPHDEEYYRRRQRIGRTHVRVGLPERYTFTAMSLLREDLCTIAHRSYEGERALRMLQAISKLSELELAVMTGTYIEAHEQAELKSLQDLIVRNMPVTVLCLDAAGNVTAATRPSASLFGYRDRTGSHYSAYLPEDLMEAADLPTRIGEALAIGSDVTIPRVVIGAGSAARYYRISLVPLHHEMARLLVHIEELTDAVQSEARLQQAESLARIGSLAANVAHEIRNPLAAISATLQVIGGTLPVDDRRKGVLLKVQEQVHRLDRLVSDLLGYARPAVARLEKGPLEPVVREALALSGVEAEFAVEADEPVMLDGHFVTQILVNLLQNARDASGPEGRIRLLVGPPGQVRVVDNGPGVPAEARERLFQAFFTTKTRGTGLGLAISRKLAEAMGGQLDLENTPSGASFRLALPS